jgi:hypothetical protein
LNAETIARVAVEIDAAGSEIGVGKGGHAHAVAETLMDDPPVLFLRLRGRSSQAEGGRKQGERHFHAVPKALLRGIAKAYRRLLAVLPEAKDADPSTPTGGKRTLIDPIS